jgi:hypothetical protein
MGVSAFAFFKILIKNAKGGLPCSVDADASELYL